MHRSEELSLVTRSSDGRCAADALDVLDRELAVLLAEILGQRLEPLAGVDELHLALAVRRLPVRQSLGAWGEVFGGPVIATAILDRLLHHSITVNIHGESY